MPDTYSTYAHKGTVESLDFKVHHIFLKSGIVLAYSSSIKMLVVEIYCPVRAETKLSFDSLSSLTGDRWLLSFSYTTLAMTAETTATQNAAAAVAVAAAAVHYPLMVSSDST